MKIYYDSSQQIRGVVRRHKIGYNNNEWKFQANCVI